MPTVCGCDLSSHYVDLVLLDETTDDATWHRYELPANPLGRLLEMPTILPTASWWDDHGVYLIALERPMSRFIKSLQALLPVYGAVAASLPAGVQVWEFTPGEMKKEFVGNGAGTKEQTKARCIDLGFGDAPDLPQDMYDAYSAAWVARELNARAIRKAA